MKPIPLGADLCVQRWDFVIYTCKIEEINVFVFSLTKYYDGHNMTVGGAVSRK